MPEHRRCSSREHAGLLKTVLALSSYFSFLTLANNTLIIDRDTLNHFPVLDVLTPKAPGLLPRAFSADGH